MSILVVIFRRKETLLGHDFEKIVNFNYENFCSPELYSREVYFFQRLFDRPDHTTQCRRQK